LGSLLVNQIKITQGRLLMRVQFEQYCRRGEFIGRGNSIVARAGDGSGAVFIELVIAQLE
jgi:hypothetical protein